MPIITLGTAPNRETDSVAIASSGIRRSSIPPPAPLDPTPSPLGSDGGINLLNDIPRMRPPADSLVETVAAPSVSSSGISWSEPVAQQKSAGGIIVQDKRAAEAAAELVAWLKENKLV